MPRTGSLSRTILVFLLLSAGALFTLPAPPAFAVLSADLSVNVSVVPDPVVANGNITYTITLTNNGPDAAQNVVLTDVLPAHTTVVAALQTGGVTFTITSPAPGATGTFSASRSSFAAAATSTFALVVKVDGNTPDQTVIGDTASVTEDLPDPTPGNNSASISTTVNNRADLNVTLTPSGTPVAGSNFDYALALSNLGPNPSLNVQLVATTGPNITLVSITTTSAGNHTLSVAGTALTVTGATMASGEAWTFTLHTHVNSGTEGSTIVYQAVASEANTDPVAGNNQTTAQSTVAGTPTFTAVAGAAFDVGVGHNGGGTPWVIGTNSVGNGNFGIYRFNGTSFDAMPGGGSRIAVDNAGAAWVLNAAGGIYRWNGTTWVQVPGAARDIGIGSEGSVWVIGVNDLGGGNFGIFQYNPGTLSFVGAPGAARRIAVGSDGQPWVLNAAGGIYHRVGVSFVVVPGVASDIGAGANGNVAVIGLTAPGTDAGIYRLANSIFTPIPGAAATIAVGGFSGTTIWVINAASQIYRIG